MSIKRRNCAVVITEMLSEIPDVLENNKLIKALEWDREDASYKAPEDTLQWERTQATLIKYLPNPTEDWQFKVLSIFTTLPIEQLKKMVLSKN